MEVGTEKQYSTLKSEVLVNDDSTITYDEHMFFELKNLVSLLNTVSTYLYFSHDYLNVE